MNKKLTIPEVAKLKDVTRQAVHYKVLSLFKKGVNVGCWEQGKFLIDKKNLKLIKFRKKNENKC